MIADLHSHILPQIDDGSASVEESIQMLRMQKAQGICTVVATPHFYGSQDRPERFLRRRAEAYGLLCQAMEKEPELPEIYLGAEVYYFQGMSDSEQLQDLTIGNSSYIMVEMPMTKWTDRMYKELQYIWEKQGLVPVIAHLDRYVSPLSDHGIPQRLEELPVLVQVNGSFFLKRATKRMALRMLKKDQIHLLGSDCHNLHTRQPNLGGAIDTIVHELGKTGLDSICDYQAQVLNRA